MRITKTEQRWFPVPEDEDGTEVLIKHLKIGEIVSVMENASVQKTIYDRTGEQMGASTEVSSNPGQVKNALCLASIVDWKNFYDENGDAMKCTKANKLRVIKEADGFLEFLIESRNTLAEDIENEKKAKEKNSLITASKEP